MRRALFAFLVILLVATVGCRKDSRSSGQGPTAASARRESKPAPPATSPEAEKLPAPTRSDAKRALRDAGYRGGSQSSIQDKLSFSLDDVPGPDGRIANVRVYERQPPSPKLDAEYRGRGGVPLLREPNLLLVVFVEKDHKPDATATMELVEKVSASTGKTIPTTFVTPSSKPSWNIKDMLEEKHVRSLLGAAKYEVQKAVADTPMDKVGNEYGSYAIGEGKRGEDRISLHLECAPPGHPTLVPSPVNEESGGAMIVDGLCVAIAHVKRGSSEDADSEASRSALLELLETWVWHSPF
jgi:hypothetical protein